MTDQHRATAAEGEHRDFTFTATDGESITVTATYDTTWRDELEPCIGVDEVCAILDAWTGADAHYRQYLWPSHRAQRRRRDHRLHLGRARRPRHVDGCYRPRPVLAQGPAWPSRRRPLHARGSRPVVRGNKTGHLRPEQIRALECDYCGHRWLITPDGMNLSDATDALSLHTARAHGTIRVQLTAITDETEQP